MSSARKTTDPSVLRISEVRFVNVRDRFDPIVGGRKIANYLRVLTLETQTLARACGKSHVHNLEPEDLRAITLAVSRAAGVPMAGSLNQH